MRSGGPALQTLATAAGSRSVAGCSTGKPVPQTRSCLTALDRELLAAAGRTIGLRVDGDDPMPRGTSASSAGTANSGVPAKTMDGEDTRRWLRTWSSEVAGGNRSVQCVDTPLYAKWAAFRSRRFRLGARGTRAAVLALLLELLADARALELRQVVDEQLAVEMIDLVLDAHGEQPVRVELDLLAVAIERSHADLLGARHLVVDTRHRQAAFLRLLDAFAREDLRIDQHQRLIAPLAHVDDEQRACATFTCVAARPMPGAAYIVSNMSSMSVRSAGVDLRRRAAHACAGADREIRELEVVPCVDCKNQVIHRSAVHRDQAARTGSRDG